MDEGIDGSSPNWRGANMKTKGRAAPADVPPSHLGGTATGLAAWGTSKPTADTNTRRHYHASQIAQTTAWDCLPCVDKQSTVCKPSNITSTSSSNSSGGHTAAEVSLSHARGNKEWRRHRRQVPPPPCTERPQGKRMLHSAAPQSTCKELLQDPAPPAQPCRTAHATYASTAAPPFGVARRTTSRTASQSMQDAGASCLPAQAAVIAAFSAATSTSQQEALQSGGPAGACPGDRDCMQRSSSKGSSSFSSRVGATMACGQAAPGCLSSSGTASQPQQTSTATVPAGSKAGVQPGAKMKGARVEDDPNYFRTPKDPPTLQRFSDSLAKMSLGSSGGLSTVQRHEAGIRARQQAQVAAAAREVAALDAGAQQDND